MNKTILKANVNGCISAPSSKSCLQRHIVASMLASGKSAIKFESISDDALHILNIVNELTGRAEIIGNTIHIEGGIIKKNAKINVGESGLGLRMLTPVLCTTGNQYEIYGQGSLLNRPIDFILNSLKDSGAKITSNNGKLPIQISGKLTNNKYTIDGSLSSQLLTGLLMAAPLIGGNIAIDVENLKSIPYIDLTINILKQYGVEIVNHNYKRFTISSMQTYKPVNTRVEGDWSSTAFVLIAAAVAGNITVKNIDTDSTQGDKKIVEVLKAVGAKVEQSKNKITVTKNRLNAFDFDATHTPDLFPPLVALAVNCAGVSKIKGVSRLIHKESNRAESLTSEFKKLSAKISLSGDYMIIEGGQLTGNTVHSHNDHRIAMALAIAALTTEQAVIIEQSEAVSKSWAEFFDVLEELVGN